MTRTIQPGRAYPLGATPDASGVNVAVFAEAADRVELCLFDRANDATETERIALAERTASVWHARVPGLAPGQLYGYRVHGPHDPRGGHRHNPHKLLLDPYAQAHAGELRWNPAVYGYPRRGDAGDRHLELDTADSAPYVPKGVVVDGAFDWGDDRPPGVPWRDTVVYEAHVLGLTRLCPDVPPEQRGTYAGLAQPAVLEYLTSLGVTAVELLPIHAFVQDEALVRRGLANYWGYNSLGFFAPERRYAAAREPGGEVREFKAMVRALHAAGLEVILDVVYNHTAEGNQRGPTLSFRGLDNRSYYRLDPEDNSRYRDFTGTGNTLDARHPRVLQLIMDSLRYWVEEMRVDGFRFDLVTALCRDGDGFRRDGAFLQAIAQDPVLARVKLIAEPWDLGPGGYQAGAFPPPWAEWNDSYRDSIRRFWRGDPNQAAELGSRLAGSSDMYAHNDRGPIASVNFVTCHDGFTLRDLVSYNHKHNDVNGEGNRDGAENNLSWNCGAEGETDDEGVQQRRERQARNFLLTLMISQGVPMLLGGDEVYRTQGGNNNAYCQDNALTWHPWALAPEQERTLAWARRAIAFRRAHPILRRRDHFRDLPPQEGERDILWLGPDGEEMSVDEWEHHATRSLGVWLSGAPHRFADAEGRPVSGPDLYIMMNSDDEETGFRLPALGGGAWALALDTARPDAPDGAETRRGGQEYRLGARSMAVLRRDQG